LIVIVIIVLDGAVFFSKRYQGHGHDKQNPDRRHDEAAML
jgi:hypothetical protein